LTGREEKEEEEEEDNEDVQLWLFFVDRDDVCAGVSLLHVLSMHACLGCALKRAT